MNKKNKRPVNPKSTEGKIIISRSKLKAFKETMGKKFQETKNWFFEKKIKIDKPTKEKKSK